MDILSLTPRLRRHGRSLPMHHHSPHLPGLPLQNRLPLGTHHGRHLGISILHHPLCLYLQPYIPTTFRPALLAVPAGAAVDQCIRLHVIGTHGVSFLARQEGMGLQSGEVGDLVCVVGYSVCTPHFFDFPLSLFSFNSFFSNDEFSQGMFLR